MSELLNLNETQLAAKIQELQSELNRRSKISQATQEIVKTLKKYNLKPDDIAFRELLANIDKVLETRAPRRTPKERKPRAKVVPKFQSLDTSLKWTGRGKAPRWVVALCEEEDITIDAFKKDSRFLI